MEEILNSQKTLLGIDDFLKTSKLYINETFPNLDMGELFTNTLKGNISTNFWTNTILDLASKELKQTIGLMATVLIIIVIHSILKSIVENLENTSTSRIIYTIQYLVIVTLITESFTSVVSITQDAIKNIVNFMNLLIPLLSTLMLTTGCITSTGIIQPIIIFMITFIGNFVNIFLIPLLLISITFSIVSNFSDKIQLNKLSNFMKSSIVWILGILITVFVCLLSIEGTLSSSVDGLTSKTAKAAISNFIPVVGKILGDSVDSIIGCGNILKNSVGVIGVIVIIGIVAFPIIKIGTLWLSFRLLSAVSEIIADEKIVRLISQISDSYKILLGVLISISFMFIVGITIVLKITNSALMYK